MTLPSPTPAEPTSEDRRLTRLSIIVTGIIGLASVVGVVAASVFSGINSVDVADKQITAENRRLESENEHADRVYLRQERQRVYGDLLAANRALVNAELDVLLPDRSLQQTSRARTKQARVARRQYYLSVDVVSVVGPRTVLAPLRSLTRAHERIATLIERARAIPNPSQAQKDAYFTRVRALRPPSSAVAASFRRAIQADDG